MPSIGNDPGGRCRRPAMREPITSESSEGGDCPTDCPPAGDGVLMIFGYRNPFGFHAR